MSFSIFIRLNVCPQNKECRVMICFVQAFLSQQLCMFGVCLCSQEKMKLHGVYVLCFLISKLTCFDRCQFIWPLTLLGKPIDLVL